MKENVLLSENVAYILRNWRETISIGLLWQLRNRSFLLQFIALVFFYFELAVPWISYAQSYIVPYVLVSTIKDIVHYRQTITRPIAGHRHLLRRGF